MKIVINKINITNNYNYHTDVSHKTNIRTQPVFTSLTVNSPNVVFIKKASKESLHLKYKDLINSLSPKSQNTFDRIITKFEKELFYDLNILEQFLDNEKQPNLNAFENLINRITKEKIETYSIMQLLELGKQDKTKDIDFDIINNFLDFRLKAIEKKNLLDRYDSKATYKDINDILLGNVKASYNTLKLIGEDAFIYSFKDKKDNVIDYIAALGLITWNEDVYNELIKLTNPKASEVYIESESNIKKLKQIFKHLKNNNNINTLKELINNETNYKKNIIKKSIKDPKDIIEKALIISALEQSSLSNKSLELLKILNPQNTEEEKMFNNCLSKILFDYYKIEVNNDKVIEKLNFENSKYLPKLFYAKRDFKEAFKRLVKLLLQNPEKNNPEIFDSLYHNELTKNSFEKLRLNYDVWSKFNPNSKIEYDFTDNTKVIVQKIDLNNIPKALFIGDETSCCTKTNGTYARCAVSYITSKMIQGIEVNHNNIPIANTMCYIAKVNGTPSLILDNIEIKPQYQGSNLIRNAIFDYAKKMVEELGDPNMPILLSEKRNDIKTVDLEKYTYDISIIGDSGTDLVYIDFESRDININNTTGNFDSKILYPISENKPKYNEKVSDSELKYYNPEIIVNNHNMNNLYFDAIYD